MLLQVFVLLGLAATAWHPPRMDGINYTGWLWAASACILAPFVLAPSVRFKQAAGYLPFLGWAVLTLKFVDGPTDRVQVQNLVQLGVPLLPLLLARGGLNSGRAPVPLRADLLTLAAGLIWLPVVLSWFKLGYGPNSRPGAISMCLITAACLGRVAGGCKWAWVGVGLAAGYSYVTGSRTGTFVIFALVGISALGVRSSWLRIALVTAALTISVLAFQSDLFQSRFFGAGHGGSGSATEVLEGKFDTSGRFKLWGRLWDECWEAPFLGRGPGSSQAVSAAYSRMPHPHNDYLKIFYEYGLVGLSLSLPFYITRGWRYTKHLLMEADPILKSCLAQASFSLAAFSALAFTDNPLLYTSHFMIPLFYLLGVADHCLASPLEQDEAADELNLSTGQGEAREANGFPAVHPS